MSQKHSQLWNTEGLYHIHANDFPHNREMIDLIRHGIDDPFQYVIFSEVGSYAGSGVKNITAIIYQDAVEEKDSFNSAYTASYPALAGALEKLSNIFEEWE